MRVTSWDFSRQRCCCRNNGRLFSAQHSVSDISQRATAGEWPITYSSFHLFRARLGETILASQSILMEEKNTEKQKSHVVLKKISSEISLFSPILKQLSETEVQNWNSAVVF